MKVIKLSGLTSLYVMWLVRAVDDIKGRKDFLKIVCNYGNCRCVEVVLCTFHVSLCSLFGFRAARTSRTIILFHTT